MMTCKLCLQDRKLSESHIIPESFWKPGYDDKHRIRAIEQARKAGITLQKGIREKLLCQSCEQFINDNYETYSSNLWFSPPLLPDEVNQKYYTFQKIDYLKFKLFHLSILWRASVSSHKMFNRVNLGPYQEIIRKMIIEKNPRSENEFQIFGTIVTFPGEKRILNNVLMAPIKQRIDNKVAYTFLFGGCLWVYVVNSAPVKILQEIVLKQNGILILAVRDMLQIKSLMSFFL